VAAIGGYPPPIPDPDWQQPVPPRRSSTRPLLLSTGGRVLLIIIIVLGVLGSIENIGSAVPQNRDVNTNNIPDQNPMVATLRSYYPAPPDDDNGLG